MGATESYEGHPVRYTLLKYFFFQFAFSYILLLMINDAHLCEDYDGVLGPHVKKKNIFAVTRLKSTRRL